jgi:hypothetical protein
MAAAVSGVAGSASADGLAPGAFAGSYLIPGTDTSFAFHGFLALELFHDASARAADFYSLQLPLDAKGDLPAEAGHSDHGGLRFSAHSTRMSLETRTPVGEREVKTYIQVDFLDMSASLPSACCQNSYVPHLRQAYVSYAGVLVGKAWSGFIDLNALPDTLDPTLEVGVMETFSGRVPQFRYSYDAGNGITIAASLENPVSSWTVGPNGAGAGAAIIPAGITNGTLANLGSAQPVPAFVLGGGIDQGFFDAALHGMVQELRVASNNDLNSALAPPGARFSRLGWGVSAGGHYNVADRDAVKATVTFGEGLGNYLWDTADVSEGLLWNSTTGEVVAPWAVGATAAFEHYWNDRLRSNVSGGFAHIDRTGATATWSPAALAALTRYDFSTHVNLIWSPVSWTDLGVEWAHVTHVAWDEQSGVLDRLIGMAKIRW